MSLPAALDEMVDGSGGVRPTWRNLFVAFAELGTDGLAERAERLDRASEEQGDARINLSSGSALGGAAAAVVPPSWRCDPVPLALSGHEFHQIERGLTQRANLLQLVLNDLYGRQQLLEDGILPSSLIYPNPAFLRARAELPIAPGGLPGPPPPPLLQFYAADLVRTPDGVWRVVADRVSDSPGIGYVQENRRLLSRILPEAFRSHRVPQVRPFFDIWRDSLERLAGGGKANPGIAILTSGARDRSWFEHLLLARELSCVLLEPGDLTVRNSGVYLKTLRGLQRIDVLVSRVRGTQLDPLELAPESAQGIPGLLDVLRHSDVCILNDPGAGILESPALPAFLPAIATALLGEELILPQVPCLWLGDEANRRRVLGEPDHWALVGQDASSGKTAVDRAHRLERFGLEPWRGAALHAGLPSVAPSFTPEGLQPRPISIRLFMVFDGEGWHALPGGIARLIGGSIETAWAGGVIGGCKDIWVGDDEHRDMIGPPPVIHAPLGIRRSTGDMPGRIAESFFWLGRYLERLETSARLVRTAVSRVGRDTPLMRDLASLEMLALCLTQHDLVSVDGAVGVPALDSLGVALLGSVRERGPIPSLMAQVTRLMDVLRDRLTADMYGVFTQTLGEAREDLRRVQPHADWRSLDRLAHSMVTLLRFTATMSGLAAENMVQGGGRLFLDLGRRVERAQAVAGSIATILEQAARPERVTIAEDWLRLVLELCDSSITYRTRYLTIVQTVPVMDLVLADPGNPRGLAHQLAAIRQLMGQIVTDQEMGQSQMIAACDALVAEGGHLIASGAAGDLPLPQLDGLATSLHAIEATVSRLSDLVARRYFALLPVLQSVGVGEQTPVYRGAA